MKLRFITGSLLTLAAATLIGCGGGGSDGVTTIATPTSASPPVTTAGSTDTTTLSTAALANLSITGSVQGVTIDRGVTNSNPVITFQLVNSDNNTALTGVEQWTTQRTLVKNGVANQTGGTTDTCRFFPNISFSIAKLVPGSDGSPAKWVSYMVSTPTLDTNCNATAHTPGRPGSENNGTLEYLGNGQYKYTFRRDITQVESQVAASAETASSKKADLGDLFYDANKVHRLVIQVSGAVRGARSTNPNQTPALTPNQINGTYCNTADGTCPSGSANTAYEIFRTPADLVFDWIPATGRVVKASDTDVEQREIVNVAACASCHNKFTFHGGNALTGFGGGRQEARQCMVCHTDQRKFGLTGTTTTDASGNFTSSSSYTINGISTDNNHSMGDFPVLIHKIHMGEELTRSGYKYASVQPNHIKYPQLITNCAKCHSGDSTKPDGSANTVTKQDGSVVQMATVQGNNWNTKPNRQACGACHDGINFNTGAGKTLAGAATGHGAGGVGGAQADDSKCATCHNPAAIKMVHVAITPQSRTNTLFADCASFGTCSGFNNAAWLASNHNNLPEGAIKVTYDVKSVSRNSSKQPVMVFRILQNGQRVDFKTFSDSTDNAVLSDEEMWPNFMGSPSAYFVFAVPQDGINTPADFNASASGYLRSIWNSKALGAGAGKLSLPDADGYYTVTLTGVTVPDNAVMLTGGLGYTYNPDSTMPLTQTNLNPYPVTDATATPAQIGNSYGAFQPNKTGGLIVVAPDVQVVASAGAAAGGTGGAYTGRRQIVEDKRCNNCHQELGAFNESQFHGGQRNDGTTCAWCHTPNRSSQGWSVDSTNFVHAIHGDLKRVKDFTYYAASTTDGFWKIGYPGVLKNCEACHIPGSYDFSNSASKAATGLDGSAGGDKRLFRYAATGIFNGTAGTVTKSWSGPNCNLGNNAQTALGAFRISPFVAKDNATSYGLGFAFNAAKTGGSPSTLCDPDNNGAKITVAAQATREASATALYETPTATVCFACHDDDTTVKPSMGATAKAHMLANGGKIYAARGASNPTQTETCLTSCHGPSSAANIKTVHAK